MSRYGVEKRREGGRNEEKEREIGRGSEGETPQVLSQFPFKVYPQKCNILLPSFTFLILSYFKEPHQVVTKTVNIRFWTYNSDSH